MSPDTSTRSAASQQEPSWEHFRLERCTATYWRVTFDHPPINTITATTVAELPELVDLIEQASELNVIVFESANRDFFLCTMTPRTHPSGHLRCRPGRRG